MQKGEREVMVMERTEDHIKEKGESEEAKNGDEGRRERVRG